MSRDQGLLRDAYLGVMTGARRRLDRTRLLNLWDGHVAAHPRGVSAHLRTLLAVHHAEDLVRMDLPWWTYEAVDVVDAFLARRDGGARVFEYGSGASTLWLARRAGSVDAVEHEAGWAERVRELLVTTGGLRCAPTVHVPEVPLLPAATAGSPARAASAAAPVRSGAPSGEGLDFTRYVRAIDDVPGDFDLVLVDGRARADVVLHVLDRVREDGMVLLDDAQRPRYRAAVDEAARRGWLVRRTRGATPCQPVPRETVLLSRDPAALLG